MRGSAAPIAGDRHGRHHPDSWPGCIAGPCPAGRRHRCRRVRRPPGGEGTTGRNSPVARCRGPAGLPHGTAGHRADRRAEAAA
ncbi:hypothetical protein G6F61_015047 [Rhizopus arrhizus]|nr:hypothetical protein G6F61_015047 [Rhizopus arrhizus]